MEKLKLIAPAMEYKQAIMDFRQEFLNCGDSMDGGGSLKRFERLEEWLAQIEQDRNWALQFICIRESDCKMVGILQIRYELNDYLREYAGHIGYSVRPSERRKGYATWMLQNALPHCKTVGISDVMISCLVDNEGSRRTILRNGGIYAETVQEPREGVMLEKYWIHI